MSVSDGRGRREVASEARRDSLDRLVPAVYEQLRRIASHHLAQRDGHASLSPTGLVHEAYLKLVGQSRLAWKDRAHFLALASSAMRHVLVDRARARLAFKRHCARDPLTLESIQLPADTQPQAMLDLNDAIERLAAVEPRLARIVELRFF